MAEEVTSAKKDVIEGASPVIPKWVIYLGVPVAAICVTSGLYYLLKKRKAETHETDSHKQTSEGPEPLATPTTKSESEGKVQEQNNAQAAKLKGNKYFKGGKYEQAIQCYSDAIALSKSESKEDISTYYQNRAAAQEQLKNWDDVVSDCTEALKLKPKYGKALARRARAYESLGQKRDCLEDVTAVCILEGFQNQQCILQADRILKELGKELAAKQMKEKKPSLPSSTFVQSYLDSFSTLVFDDEFTDDDKQSSPYFRASEDLKKKQFENVVDQCSQEIEQDGKFKNRALLLRGTMYTLMSDIPGAMADFAILIDLQNSDENRKQDQLEFQLRGLKRFSDARWIHKASATLKSNALIKRGSLKMQQSLDKDCLSDFQEAVSIDEHNADVYHHRGQIYFLTEKLQEAKADFEKAIALSPDFVAPRLQLGYCQCKLALQLQSMPLMDAADKILEETTRLFPESPDAFSLHGQLLQDQQKFDEAEKKLDKALELNPTNPTTYVYKALLMLQWKQDLEKANQLIRKGLAVDDKCDFAYETLATLEVQRGNLDEAAHLFQKAIDLVRTENEMAHTFSLLEAAKAQGNVTKKLGISLPTSPFMM